MPTPLHIASILRALPGASGQGGVSYQAHELNQRLALGGHQVTVFSADPAPPGAAYEVRRIPVADAVKQRRWFLYGGFARLVRQQDFSGFDLIHAHGDNQFLSRRPAPLVRTYWGSDLGEALADLRPRPLLAHFLGYGFEWLAREHAEVTVGISAVTRRHLPFLEHLVPPGVDRQIFRPGPHKSPAPSVLFVAGTLDGRKRGRLLIEAFRRHVRPALPGAELWLVCPEKVEGEGIRSLGTLPHDAEGVASLAHLYRQAWVFCLPSSYEGFGVPYLEALASGTPVVATPNPGAREVLREGQLGILTAPGALGPTLVRVLGDTALRERLAARGVEAAAEYDFAGVVERYEEIFREVASRARTQPISR